MAGKGSRGRIFTIVQSFTPFSCKVNRVSVLPLANPDEVMVKWNDWHLKDGLKSSVY